MSKKGVVNLILFLVLCLFLFQNALAEYIPYLIYLDEVFPLLLILIYLSRGRIAFQSSSQMKILLACILLLVFGIIGNYLYSFQTDILIILFDYYKIIKTFITFILMYELLGNFSVDSIIRKFSKLSILYILIAFYFMFLIYIFDLPLYDGVRFGLKEYKFIMPTAGIFGYTLMPCIMSIIYTKNHKNRYVNNTVIFIGLVLIASTWKGPQLTFVVSLVLLYVYYNSRLKFRMYHIVALFLVVLLIGQYQITNYLLNQTSPRYFLISTGFRVFIDYFPFGTGFATFGSEMSSRYYSNVYYIYNLDKIWGLNQVYDGFITDNYWPMILGQFGIFGLSIMVYIMYHMYVLIFKNHKIQQKMVPIILSSLLAYLIGSIGNPYIISDNAIFYVIMLSVCIKAYDYKLKLVIKFEKTKLIESNKKMSIYQSTYSEM